MNHQVDPYLFPGGGGHQCFPEPVNVGGKSTGYQHCHGLYHYLFGNLSLGLAPTIGGVSQDMNFLMCCVFLMFHVKQTADASPQEERNQNVSRETMREININCLCW